MASIVGRKNMHGYLSADIAFPVMPFEDQIMFKDKYASVISGQMEVLCLSSFKYFSQRAGKLFTISQLFTASDVRVSMLFGTILRTKTIYIPPSLQPTMFIDLKLNFVHRVFRFGHKVKVRY